MSSVFMIKNDELVVLEPTSFASEDEFQRLLAAFPALLAGKEIDTENPRRFLLVRREAPIPSHQDGASRWSVDHLFLDQDGVPTLVEVKRQSDTRIRREVVGQMLDYAANSVVYWPVDEIRVHFETVNDDPERLLSEFLEGSDREKFWQSVKTNLQAGRVRLIFVADEIPPELRRIVEFLNAQMDPAEVLALELRRFGQEGVQTIVPVVFGKTQAAIAKKSVSGPVRKWDLPAILAILNDSGKAHLIPAAQKIAEWIQSNAYPSFGAGQEHGNLGAVVPTRLGDVTPLKLWTNGSVALHFNNLVTKFDEINKQWFAKLKQIDGILKPNAEPIRQPEFKLDVLIDDEKLRAFLETMHWLTDQLRKN